MYDAKINTSIQTREARGFDFDADYAYLDSFILWEVKNEFIFGRII